MTNDPSQRFSLGTFSGAGRSRFPGLVLPRGDVVPLDPLTPVLQRRNLRLEGAQSVLGLLSSWSANLPVLKVLATALNARPSPVPADVEALALHELHVHAPIHLPRQIFCTVANYRSHILDTVRGPAPDARLGAPDTPECLAKAATIVQERLRGSPYACLKLPSAVIGPNDPLEIPSEARKTDWELELGVVIGVPCRKVSRADAMRCVAGYVLVNDITVRERVVRPDLPRLGSDWLQSKNSPGFLPTGPFLVPADFVQNPYSLRLQLSLNGALMQSELTSDMIFDIAAQIEYLSRYAQLWPGDIICTGTPAGCGTRYERFLRPGDLMEGTADGLGTQRTRCVAEQACETDVS